MSMTDGAGGGRGRERKDALGFDAVEHAGVNVEGIHHKGLHIGLLKTVELLCDSLVEPNSSCGQKDYYPLTMKHRHDAHKARLGTRHNLPNFEAQ